MNNKRKGTVSLLAGIDLLTGKVHALVRDRHRSREFIEFLKLIDAACPTHTAIKLILDNHSAHISKETKAWLADQPAGRFEFTFTPKHGSWLNLVESFFSKLARSVLCHIRVTSKQELEDRIMATTDHFNQDPASTRGLTNSIKPPDMIRTLETMYQLRGGAGTGGSTGQGGRGSGRFVGQVILLVRERGFGSWRLFDRI
jgi:transposase